MTGERAEGNKGSFGCLGYGCAVAVFLLVAVLGLVFFYVLSSFRGAVDKYTVPSAGGFQVTAPAPDVASSSGAKLARLAALIENPSASGQEVFNGPEVTAVMQRSLGPVVEVAIDGDVAQVRFGVPLAGLYGDSFWPRLLLGSRESRVALGSGTAKLTLREGTEAPGAPAVIVELLTLQLGAQQIEGDALVRASEWFSGWATAEVNAPRSPELGRPSLLGRLGGLKLIGGQLEVAVRAAP